MSGRMSEQVLVYRTGKVYHRALDSRATPVCSPWGKAGRFVERFTAIYGEKRSACRRCWPEQEQEGL